MLDRMLKRIADILGKWLNLSVPPWLVFLWALWAFFMLPSFALPLEYLVVHLNPDSVWPQILWWIAIPSIALVALAALTRFNVNPRTPYTVYRSPERHRVLVFNVSFVRPTPEITALLGRLTALRTADEMFEAVRDGALQHTYVWLWLRAVEWHRPELERCYLVRPRDLYPLVNDGVIRFDKEKWKPFILFMERYARLRNVELFELDVVSAQNVEAVRLKIHGLLRELEGQRIPPADVVVDITSGTSAMSAGGILATLPNESTVQYFPQYREPELLELVQDLAENRRPGKRVSRQPEDLAWGPVKLEEQRPARDIEREGLLPLEVLIDVESVRQDMELPPPA